MVSRIFSSLAVPELTYLNQDGLSFANAIHETPTVGPAWSPGASLMFGDMNGSGVDDLVIVQYDELGNGNAWYADLLDGQRPGLLTSINNGIGATTSIAYASTTDLAAKCASTERCAVAETGPAGPSPRDVDLHHEQPARGLRQRDHDPVHVHGPGLRSA